MTVERLRLSRSCVRLRFMVELASPGQDITQMELAQATRNRGMPLEALRHDVTPVGLHNLLIHFDIPALDPALWRLRIGGNVRRELALTLDEIRARPASTMPVTLECAGNGRARLEPRPMTQPWLHEAVATASWTGTSLATVLDRGRRRAGHRRDRLHGGRPRHRGRRGTGLRSLAAAHRGDAPGSPPCLRDERPAAGTPARVPPADCSSQAGTA